MGTTNTISITAILLHVSAMRKLSWRKLTFTCSDIFPIIIVCFQTLQVDLYELFKEVYTTPWYKNIG
jgi:hypothetical protein